MSLILSLDPSALEDKYISIGEDTYGEEAVQDIYAIPIRRCNKTYYWISRLAKYVLCENLNSISNTKTAVNGNKFIDEGGIAIVEDVSKDGIVDKEDGADCKGAIYFGGFRFALQCVKPTISISLPSKLSSLNPVNPRPT